MPLPDLLTFTISAALVFGGAIVSGMAGFGFGIVTIPFLLLLFPPKFTLSVTTTLVAIGVIVQWFRVRHQADYRLVATLSFGMLLGLPLGGLVIASLSDSTLKVLIGGAVLAGTTSMLLRRENADLPPRRPHSAVTAGVGALSGVLATTVGQPGIPLAFLITWSRLEKSVARASLIAFFVLLDIGTIWTFVVSRVMTVPAAWTTAALFPFYLGGLLLGDMAFRRSGQAAYRRLVLGVLLTAAVMGLYNGARALLA